MPYTCHVTLTPLTLRPLGPSSIDGRWSCCLTGREKHWLVRHSAWHTEATQSTRPTVSPQTPTQHTFFARPGCLGWPYQGMQVSCIWGKVGMIKFQTPWTCRGSVLSTVPGAASGHRHWRSSCELSHGRVLPHSTDGSGCEWSCPLVVMRNTAAKLCWLSCSRERKQEYFRSCLCQILETREVGRFWVVPENGNSRCSNKKRRKS